MLFSHKILETALVSQPHREIVVVFGFKEIDILYRAQLKLTHTFSSQGQENLNKCVDVTDPHILYFIRGLQCV